MSQSNVLLDLKDATPDSVMTLEAIGAEVRIDLHLDMGGMGGRRGQSAFQASTSSASQAELRAGYLVAGRYELKRVLGRGSMGTVWLANHKALDEEVAVKLLAPAGELTGIENASTTAARFRFEAQVAARLSRKTRHVVRVTDHGHDGALAFLVMERLEGQTLERALSNRGPMPPLEVSSLLTQLARGLEVAHAEGVLHRDLKPSNVFLTAGEDGALLAKILDFGIARRDRTSGVDTRFATAQGVLFGTPGYMSPEQASAASDLDSRADLWSLAAIAYEALTGELPVAGHDTEQMLANLRLGKTVPLRHRNADLPEACERFFERAFAPCIDDRHPSCAELALDFEHAVRATGSRGAARTVALKTLRLGAPAGAPAPLRLRTRRKVQVLAAFAATALAVAAMWCAFALHARPALGMGPAMGGGAEASPTDSPPTAAHREPAVAPPFATPLVIRPSASVDVSETVAPLPASAPSSRKPSGSLGEFKAYF